MSFREFFDFLRDESTGQNPKEILKQPQAVDPIAHADHLARLEVLKARDPVEAAKEFKARHRHPPNESQQS